MLPALLFFFFKGYGHPRDLPSSPPRRSPDPRRNRGGADNTPRRIGQRQLIARGQRLLTVRPGIHNRVGDRKSTRLNPRHLGISYVVFRLQKKTRGASSRPSATPHRHDRATPN